MTMAVSAMAGSLLYAWLAPRAGSIEFLVLAGSSVAHAWEQLYFLNRACQAQVLAMSTGQPLKKIPEPIVKSVAREIETEGSGAAANYQRHFTALKRLLESEEPNYRH